MAIMGYTNSHEQRSLIPRDDHTRYSTSSEEIDLDAIEDAVARSTPTASHPPRWLTRYRRRGGSARSSQSSYFDFHRTRRRGLFVRLLHRLFFLPHILVCIVLVIAVFFPSYTNPPSHYTELRTRVKSSNTTGAANLHNEKIFIAASLHDKEGELVSGQWARSVLNLIHILGPENVFLSLYENDPDAESIDAMTHFEQLLPCNASIFHEHLDTAPLPHLTMPDSSSRLRRIPFLAEVRNKALLPLDDPTSPASTTKFDRLLYLNDIAFDAVDAANLLFSTNIDTSTGRAQYRAACAADFVNPLRYYDTFATRDLEGFEMGESFYPWFTSAGKGESRRDVLAQKDAVRVKSCWGGMVAFEGRWFQPGLHIDGRVEDEEHPANPGYQAPAGNDAVDLTTVISPSNSSPNTAASPLRFRALTEPYRSASECCLIHADLTALSSPADTQIYLNPYIRVAYSASLQPYLHLLARFERLFQPLSAILNLVKGKPRFNPRRLHEARQEVIERVWQEDKGKWEDVTRRADAGGFCGTPESYFIKQEGDGDEFGHGAGVWGKLVAPEGWQD